MPLKGLKVIEMSGLAPAPICGKFLHDFGASVIKIDRTTGEYDFFDVSSRGKKSISLNLKSEDAVKIVKKLCVDADVFIDPFRKGVMEKFGLGPKNLMSENEKLIYARLSGYGQYGHYSSRVGHDINFLSITGLLSHYGWRGKNPTPPCNYSEFAGGSFCCFAGILLAIIDRTRTGKGQVVDANITEGISYIGSWFAMCKNVLFNNHRGENWLDGGAHFYDTYETKDGKFMAVGAIEPQFYSELLSLLNLKPDEVSHVGNYNEGRKVFEQIFKTKTQKEWCDVFDTSDACVTPVLNYDQAIGHPHNVERNSFVKYNDGSIVPNRAPRLGAHPGGLNEESMSQSGHHTTEILSSLGYNDTEIVELEKKGIVKILQIKNKL